jgi:glutathione S-transferase
MQNAFVRTWLFESRPLQADITSAVAWRFTQNALPGLIRDEVHSSLAAFSARAESTPAFRSLPADEQDSPGIVHHKLPLAGGHCGRTSKR